MNKILCYAYGILLCDESVSDNKLAIMDFNDVVQDK